MVSQFVVDMVLASSVALILLTQATQAACVSATAADGECMADEPSALLQLGSNRENTSAGFPLRFEIFSGTPRIMLPIRVAGHAVEVVVDTGSNSFALCPSAPVHPSEAALTPKSPSSDIAYFAYEAYGGNSHGWMGYFYTGLLELEGESSSIKANASFAKMFRQFGMGGANGCGKPGSGSIGATSMDGIIGFGPRGLHGLPCLTSGSVAQLRELNTFEGNWEYLVANHYLPGCDDAGWTRESALEISPAQHLLAAAQTEQFGIYWSGNYGPDSGKLYLKDAAAKASGMAGGVHALLDHGSAHYCFTILSWSVSWSLSREASNIKNVSSSGFKKVSSSGSTGNAYVDSGATGIPIPPLLYNVILELGESATVSIEVLGLNGQKSSLELPASSKQDFVSKRLSDPNIGRNGIQLWNHYNYIVFGSKAISFYPRSG